MNANRSYSNILLIKPGAIGDLLELTPVIRALADRFRGARITLLVGTKETATLFLHNPRVSEVIVWDKRGEHKSLVSLMKLWSRLRRRKYDLVVHFQRSNPKAWILASAAFPCRVLVYHKSRRTDVHVLDNYLDTIAPLGIPEQERRLELYTGREDDAYAEGLFSREGWSSGVVIALNPGASNDVKVWGISQFTELADALAETLSAKIIIIGGKEDTSLAERIAGNTKKARPIVMAGKTTLLQLGAVLRKCDLLISGDTGPLHLATAVGTRVVGLYGSVDPVRTGPVGPGHRVMQAKDVPCVPCRSLTCAHSVRLECMNRITVRDVLDVVLDMLGTVSPERI